MQSVTLLAMAPGLEWLTNDHSMVNLQGVSGLYSSVRSCAFLVNDSRSPCLQELEWLTSPAHCNEFNMAPTDPAVSIHSWYITATFKRTSWPVKYCKTVNTAYRLHPNFTRHTRMLGLSKFEKMVQIHNHLGPKSQKRVLPINHALQDLVNKCGTKFKINPKSKTNSLF